MNRIRIILFFVVFSAIAIGQNFNKNNQKKDNKIVFSNQESADDYLLVLEKALKLLKTNYVDSINESEMVISGIKGLMTHLDPYTKLLMKDAKSSYDDLRTGKFGGIGIYIGMRRDTLTVLGTIENSPAYSEGLQIGDNILMIDSTHTKNLTIKECTNLIKGELDSLVTLTIYRSATREKINFDLTRSNIPLKNVPYSGVNKDGIGYIRINRFSKNVDKDFKEGLKTLIDKEINGLIIDLRGNSGGLLRAAINILDNLTDRGDSLLIQKGKTPKSNATWKSRRSPILDLDVPLIVLIDKRSASASEIVSGAIQDLDRGIIVGQKSYGKGLVQHMYDLNDSTTLKITTAKFYLPSGRLIQKQDYLDNGFLTDGLDKKDSIFTTKSGRIVEGGGGITPDVITDRNSYSRFINALYKEKVFLTFATDYIPRNPNIKEKFKSMYKMEVAQWEVENPKEDPNDWYRYISFEKEKIPNEVFVEFRKWLYAYNLEYKMIGELEYEKMKNKILSESISINKYSGLISETPAYDMVNELDKYFNTIKDIQINLPDNKIAIENGLLREFCRILFNEEKRIEVSLINDITYNRALEILKNQNEYYKLLGY